MRWDTSRERRMGPLGSTRVTLCPDMPGWGGGCLHGGHGGGRGPWVPLQEVWPSPAQAVPRLRRTPRVGRRRL